MENFVETLNCKGIVKTRGENGEWVFSIHKDTEGDLWVFDATFGLINIGKDTPELRNELGVIED